MFSSLSVAFCAFLVLGDAHGRSHVSKRASHFGAARRALSARSPDPMTDSTAILEAIGQRRSTLPSNATLVPRSSSSLSRRYSSSNDYQQVFSGSGTGPDDRDAAVQGDAYLTFTVLSNATYNVDACLQYCDGIATCVFVNLYYEFNNEQLDFVDKSNLKCAAFADVYTAAAKTNWGHQQSYHNYGQPPPLTYMKDSTGWAADFFEPPTPEGYDLVYGPTGGANNAPGYMGFTFLDKYDVNACAHLCNTRGADSKGGACQYFNIWRAVVDGKPTTTCSMYYLVADPSTATNYGQGSLKVTWARGYSRKNLVPDPDFEGDDSNWQKSYSSSMVHDASTAFQGTGAGTIGSPNPAGTLSPAQPVNTVAGKSYVLTFFASSRLVIAGSTLSGSATITILWNGASVSSITPTTTDWTYYSVPVTAQGNDKLTFQQGDLTTYTLLDNVFLFLQ